MVHLIKKKKKTQRKYFILSIMNVIFGSYFGDKEFKNIY